mmetsp:Transcript_23049/g.87146  ORF Transcript_23049/g.87146 Transcript_23049/m.87146 type:complete len:350 (+) Transcript_23049:411-1460(+)
MGSHDHGPRDLRPGWRVPQRDHVWPHRQVVRRQGACAGAGAEPRACPPRLRVQRRRFTCHRRGHQPGLLPLVRGAHLPGELRLRHRRSHHRPARLRRAQGQPPNRAPDPGRGQARRRRGRSDARGRPWVRIAPHAHGGRPGRGGRAPRLCRSNVRRHRRRQPHRAGCSGSSRGRRRRRRRRAGGPPRRAAPPPLPLDPHHLLRDHLLRDPALQQHRLRLHRDSLAHHHRRHRKLLHGRHLHHRRPRLALPRSLHRLHRHARSVLPGLRPRHHRRPPPARPLLHHAAGGPRLHGARLLLLRGRPLALHRAGGRRGDRWNGVRPHHRCAEPWPRRRAPRHQPHAGHLPRGL